MFGLNLVDDVVAAAAGGYVTKLLGGGLRRLFGPVATWIDAKKPGLSTGVSEIPAAIGTSWLGKKFIGDYKKPITLGAGAVAASDTIAGVFHGRFDPLGGTPSFADIFGPQGMLGGGAGSAPGAQPGATALPSPSGGASLGTTVSSRANGPGF